MGCVFRWGIWVHMYANCVHACKYCIWDITNLNERMNKYPNGPSKDSNPMQSHWSKPPPYLERDLDRDLDRVPLVFFSSASNISSSMVSCPSSRSMSYRHKTHHHYSYRHTHFTTALPVMSWYLKHLLEQPFKSFINWDESRRKSQRERSTRLLLVVNGVIHFGVGLLVLELASALRGGGCVLRAKDGVLVIHRHRLHKERKVLKMLLGMCM